VGFASAMASDATKLHAVRANRLELLSTKLILPRVTGLIERPRLLGLAAQVEVKQLAVIKAGAGFGKTCLAASWGHHLRQAGNLVGWLSLDADDDEPTQFLFYVAHGLRRVREALGKQATDLIREASLISPRAIVSTLSNELAEIDEEVYLFVDDYHWITNSEIHSAVSLLLRYAPPQFHLVLTSRVEPALPLTQLRARNQLLEIDATGLRFELEETRQFFERENLGKLSLQDVRILNAKTGGWAAVLRIIASTLLHEGENLGQYVRGLAAAQRPVGDYLAEMVNGLPEEMVEFMLRSAILDRISTPLAQAVTRIESSQDMLDSMEARQLLVAPLDEEGQWYRYHPLLRDYLMRRLEAELADQIPWLHRRASRWYASHELWTNAVHHAIAAGDTDQAIKWIENCAMALVKKGDLLTLMSWQRLFPKELMRNQRRLRLAIAWGMALVMRFEEARQLAAQIEHDLGDANTQEIESLGLECQTIRSVAAALEDDTEGAVPLAQRALDRATDPWTANVASNVIRLGRWKSGDLQSAYAARWVPYSPDEHGRNLFSSIYRLCLHGLMEIDQLRLGTGEHFFANAMELAEQYAGRESVAAALPASLMAQVYYEHGRLDDAENLVIDRLTVVNATGMLECVLRCYLVLVRIAACRHNFERAHALLDQAENLAHIRGWGRLFSATLVERLRLHLGEGRMAEAGSCVDRLRRLEADFRAPRPCAWSEIHWHTLFGSAQLASAQNRSDEAIAIMTKLRTQVEDAGNYYLALQVATELSVLLLGAGAPNAVQTIRDVVRAATTSGAYQTILDQGHGIVSPLIAFRERAGSDPHERESVACAERLIAGWHARYTSETAPTARAAATASLSSRELKILELIGKGGSNKVIASSLGIAPETVKSHVKNIFMKLSVERRAQAVARAQSMGLISTA
jgi:LuxR family transcriptional regulator, maltose regulon positive regulatory protein